MKDETGVRHLMTGVVKRSTRCLRAVAAEMVTRRKKKETETESYLAFDVHSGESGLPGLLKERARFASEELNLAIPFLKKVLTLIVDDELGSVDI